MDQSFFTQVLTRTRAWPSRAVCLLRKLPLTGQVALALLVLVAVFVAVHQWIAPKDFTLRLKVQHSFRSGQLWVYVDDDLAYSGKLNGSLKKRFGLIPDSVQGSLSETLQLASGAHHIKVRASAEDGTVQEDTISGDFARNSQRTLSVVVRHSDLGLSWQGSAGSLPDPEPSSGWFSKYASSLFLTAAGSIISALTGFALKELPNQMRSRQSATPKPEA